MPKGFSNKTGLPNRKGAKHSKKSKREMSQAKLKNPTVIRYWLGKHRSEETKKKLSEVHSGEKNYFYGRKHSKETLNKLSELKKGEKHWNWQGGKSFEPYSADWTETLKKSIRERDCYICQLCGKTQIEELERIERKLAIHHINYDKKNCDPNNLITLCASCNAKVNKSRDYWINYFS